MAGRGIFTVVYRDNGLAAVDARIIHIQHFQLDTVARTLSERYAHNNITSDFKEGKADYLIAGVLVKTNRICFPKREVEVDEISFHSETKVALEFLARDLGLPDIPSNSFHSYDSIK